MTRDDHHDVVALLERKVNATAPRDADPVGSVLRRARAARRRRVLAGTCAAVVAGAGLGVAGALVLTDGAPSPAPVADGSNATNVRPVTDWTGETVTFHGLTLPVPDGWTVRHSDDVRGTCLGAAPKTMWLFDVPAGQQFLGGCGRPGASPEQVWVVPQELPAGSFGGDNPVALDPSGQPVMQPDLSAPSQPFAGLGFPWLDVELHSNDVPDTELLTMLAATHAAPVAPSPGLHLPSRIDEASYQRFGGGSRQDPQPHGLADVDVVQDVLRSARPDTALRCVPQVGASLMLTQKNPDSYDESWLLFDTTGTCDQVTDDKGGLATLAADGLRALAEQVHALPGTHQPSGKGSGPASGPRPAAAQPPVHQPELDQVLHCPTGQQQDGLQVISKRSPWFASPRSAGEDWLGRQSDRDEFATVGIVFDDAVKAHLLVKDRDGDTTGVVYLLVNTRSGWKLQGQNLCGTPPAR